MARLAPGQLAEEYFLQAARQTGFREVTKTDPKTPWTIRKATDREEGQKIDFIFTFLWEGRRCSEPLQLTLCRNRKDSKLKCKLRMLELAGKVALFWPAKDLTGQRMLKLLEMASKGDRDALQWFYDRLEFAFAELFRYREKKRIAKHRLRELSSAIIPQLPKKLRRKTQSILRDRQSTRYHRLSLIERLIAEKFHTQYKRSLDTSDL